MFDRGNKTGALSVELTLAEGQKLIGRFIAPQGRALQEILNGNANFLEFETTDTRRTFIAKSTIASVSSLDSA
jgi:hypothetical protein